LNVNAGVHLEIVFAVAANLSLVLIKRNIALGIKIGP
jgi:hypothetical protein